MAASILPTAASPLLYIIIQICFSFNFGAASSALRSTVTRRASGFTGNGRAAYQAMGDGLSPGDPNSYSKPDEISISHIHLKLKVDFDQKILGGLAILTADRQKDGVRSVLLDSRDLTILEVTDGSINKLEYKLHEPVAEFGSKLEIFLPDETSKHYSISIGYKSSPSASALQWLPPEQTAGKRHPYLFSQCQAIHCRSIIPCQDTPSAKITYSAEIAVPSALVVLMSAVKQGTEPGASGWTVHKFEQKIPVPSYLIAMAIGDLEFRHLGPRSKVWSEKELVEQAAYEFADTEKMLSTAEDLCGPYVWGVYDLLVLPPSFPYGGMENPCITFVTPTLLAGDRSLADVVTHEIAHSWTGNLVTNKNFEHFWLNEGFTMFVERKIIGRMYGKDHRLFSAFRGLKELNDTLKARGYDDPLTQLVVDLKSKSPDDAFSVVPYEKGHTFLFYLEELAGGPDKFDPFLKDYLDKFKYQSIVTNDFKNYLYEYFPDNEALKMVDWNAWLGTPGSPPVVPNYETALEKACSELKSRWVQWSGEGNSPFAKSDVDSMSAVQVQEFLSQLLLEQPLSVEKLKAMEQAYGFNSVRNCEIKYRWLRLCLQGHWTEQIADALKFVTEQGRMRYTRPLYRELYEWEEARPEAIKVFNSQKDGMMYVAAYSISKDLHISQ